MSRPVDHPHQRRLSAAHRIDGAVALELISNWDQWIKRRVEKVDFVTESSVRHRLSVDFRLPEWIEDVDGLWSEGPQTMHPGLGRWIPYVPLTFLEKAVILDVNLRDESGRALPLATRRRTSLLAGGAMLRLAQLLIFDATTENGVGFIARSDRNRRGIRLSDPRQIELSPTVQQWMCDLADLPFDDRSDWRGHSTAQTLIRRVDHATKTPEPPSQWRWFPTAYRDAAVTTTQRGRLRHASTMFRLPVVTPSAGGHGLLHPLPWLLEQEPFRRLVSDFARLWMVSVPLVDDRLRRHVVKMTYTEAVSSELRLSVGRRAAARLDRLAWGRIGWTQDLLERIPAETSRSAEPEWQWPGPDPGAASVARSSKSFSWLTQALGWRGKTVHVICPGIGRGGSFHFESRVPSGLQIRRSRLSSYRVAAPASPSSCPDRAEQDGLDQSSFTASRFARSLEHDNRYLRPASPGHVGGASLTLKLRPVSGTGLRSLTFLAALITLALGGTAYLLHTSASGTAALSPILLLVPAILFAVALRGDEHPLVTNMLIGPRLLALGATVCSVASAGVLALSAKSQSLLVLSNNPTISTPTAATVVTVLAGAALLAAFSLTVGWLLARRSQPDGRAP